METEKLFVPLTRINNKTLVTMVCTKRDSKTGMLSPGKRIPPGGNIYMVYRKDESSEYEFWFHVEGRGYDEGEMVLPHTVYRCAELDIEPSSSSLLGFNLVRLTGPMLGRFLVSRLAKSYGLLGCLADPVVEQNLTTPTAVDPGQASTTLVAPEVQLGVNRGQDSGATLDAPTAADPSATLAPPAIVEADPGATLDPLVADDPSATQAPPAIVAADPNVTLAPLPLVAVDPSQDQSDTLDPPAAADPGQNPGDTIYPLAAADPSQDPHVTLVPLAPAVAADPSQDSGATLAPCAPVAADPSQDLGATIAYATPIVVDPSQDLSATLALVATDLSQDPCATLASPTPIVADPGATLAPPDLVADLGATLAPAVPIVAYPGQDPTINLLTTLVANPGQATTIVLTPQVPMVVDPGQALGTIS